MVTISYTKMNQQIHPSNRENQQENIYKIQIKFIKIFEEPCSYKI